MVVGDTRHGGNGKVANLINKRPEVKHDIIVLAVSDVHVTPHFLERIVAALDGHEVGVVIALYPGFASSSSLTGRFWAAQINHMFLPGALVGWMPGRQDSLGAPLALRRSTLTGRGGLPALLPLRELLSIAVLLSSYLGYRVVWRGGTAAVTSGREPRSHVGRPRPGQEFELRKELINE